MDATKYIRRCILDMKDYVPGKPIEEVQRELGLRDVIKMASNENLLGQSPQAVQAMIDELRNNGHYYPESGCTNLVKSLAKKHSLSPENFVVDNGVDGVIKLLALACVEQGDEVICGQYTFPAYASVTTLMGGKPVAIPHLGDYRLDVDGFIRAISPRTKLIFLCNPNNPTGTISKTGEFEKLLNALPERALLISDEAYFEFVDDPDYPRSIEYMGNHPQLVILRTFSKLMGLAGVRVGYAMADKELVRMLMKVRDPFPVNRAAQAGALASMEDSDFLELALSMVKRGKEQLYQGFWKLGLNFVPSQSNFILVDLGRPCTGVYNKMLSLGIIVRPLASFGLPNCIRITVGKPEQNERALAALARALKA